MQSLRDILLLENTTAFAIEIGMWVSKREESVGFGQLSTTEQTVLCLDGLEREVNNGGFDQFFFNSAGDHALETPAALRRIGAPQMAALVEQANAAFGKKGPSPERYVRQEQMEALGEPAREVWTALDQLFYEYPEDLAALLQAYVRAHRNELGVTTGLA